MTDVTRDNLQVGEIQFYDNYIPSLEAGLYQITVEQNIENIDFKDYFKKTTQTFEVKGPQFALEPNEIHAVYPPKDSCGQYADCLPHIILNKPVIPWERKLKGCDKTVPWMALLTFEEDELIENPKTKTNLFSSTVEQFLALKDQGDILIPNIKVDASELVMNCQSIEISTAVFKALVPRKAELQYLAHCRQVDPKDQAILKQNEDGWYSVLVSNRFPKVQMGQENSGVKNIVHLVSLEGLEEYLVEDPQFPKKKSDPDQDKTIRLLSLKNWSFSCLREQGENFAELMKNFVLQEADNPENLMLKAPLQKSDTSQSEEANYAQTRISEGYVPLSFHTMLGENSYAWYRGPLTPVMSPKLPNTEPFSSASAAMIYDPIYGIFDQSYAAAWQIGRLIALSDASFVDQLFKFRQKGHRVVNQLNQYFYSDFFETSQDLQRLTGENVIKEKFEKMIEGNLSNHLQQVFAADSNFQSGAKNGLASGDTNRPIPINQLKTSIKRDDVQDILLAEMDTETKTIAQRVADLKLLYGVPFNHLVADSKMLPVESIRFFYLDQNWVNVLCDGALSIGIHSSRDLELNTMFRDKILNTVDSLAFQKRDQLLGAETEEDVRYKESDQHITGVLLRSAVVSGWPGLSIKAYKNGELLKILRMDRLSANVLLCLFVGIPDRLEISEPHQGLCFGVEDEGLIYLRSVSDHVGKPIGKTLKVKGPEFRKYMRPTTHSIGQRVLNINSNIPSEENNLVAAIGKALDNHLIGSAEFAIQMVKSPEQLVFSKLDSFIKL